MRPQQPWRFGPRAGSALGRRSGTGSAMTNPTIPMRRTGSLLLRKLAALGTVPVYVRVHNLLTSGDGTAALKWGSTGAYAEDAQGEPIYDWTITDRIFDAFVGSGVTPFVQVGFTPEALVDPSRAPISTTSPGAASPQAGPIRRATWGAGAPSFPPGRRISADRYGAEAVTALGLGGLERAGRLVLARHAGRVLRPLRHDRRRIERGSARPARGRAAYLQPG